MYQESLAGGIENLLLVFEDYASGFFRGDVAYLLSGVAGCFCCGSSFVHQDRFAGDAALVFVTGIFTNIYTVIALLSNMDFTVREGILLAMMCLISHNYPVETLVQKKTGSAGWKMVLLRFTCSFIAAAVLNLILPEFAGRMIAQPSVDLGFRDTLFNWLQTSLWLSLKVVALITGLMILQRLLEEFGILKWISSLLGPGMQLLGLPRQVAFYGWWAIRWGWLTVPLY